MIKLLSPNATFSVCWMDPEPATLYDIGMLLGEPVSWPYQISMSQCAVVEEAGWYLTSSVHPVTPVAATLATVSYALYEKRKTTRTTALAELTGRVIDVLSELAAEPTGTIPTAWAGMIMKAVNPKSRTTNTVIAPFAFWGFNIRANLTGCD